MRIVLNYSGGMRRWAIVAVLLALFATLPGCVTGSSSDSGGQGRSIRAVAVHPAWADLVRQLGGDAVEVRTLVDKPGIDPHDYEPSSDDALAFARARLVVTNGIGYDAWAGKLLDANPVDGRRVLEVGEIVDVADDGNPHQWYSPDAVDEVANAITDALIELEPDLRADFEDRRRALDRVLTPYYALLDEIEQEYAGTPIGATESIVAPLAEALGLRVLTPQRFVNAVSEGVDPSAADRATVEEQLTSKAVRVLVYNPQNATPDVQALVDIAERAGIGVVRMTETPPRVGEGFAEWQVAQLSALRDALAQAKTTQG
jgi:zinc/manganese transport system substrate-binding protein